MIAWRSWIKTKEEFVIALVMFACMAFLAFSIARVVGSEANMARKDWCINGVNAHGRLYVGDGCARVNDAFFCGNVTVKPGKCHE